jgi:hypothetical protein
MRVKGWPFRSLGNDRFGGVNGHRKSLLKTELKLLDLLDRGSVLTPGTNHPILGSYCCR